MDFLRTLLSRTAEQFTHPHRDNNLDDEIAAHLDLLIQENIANGMSQADARTAALRVFGGVAQTRETYRIQRGAGRPASPSPRS